MGFSADEFVNMKLYNTQWKHKKGIKNLLFYKWYSINWKFLQQLKYKAEYVSDVNSKYKALHETERQERDWKRT